MRRKLRAEYGFDIDMARERKVKVLSKENLLSAAKVLEKEAPDVILMFMPDENNDVVGEQRAVSNDPKKSPPQPTDEDEDYYSLARYFRSLALARGLPCQVIHRATLDDPEAMPRVLLSVLGKTGNLPFVLDEPLGYTDFVVGLDVVTAEKPNEDESLNMTFTARVYRSDGALLRYVGHTVAVAVGEPIPLAALNTLFPLDEMKKKRVLLHYGGRLGSDIRALLVGWSNAAKITFKLVEIMQYSAPRLYALDKGKITGAPVGSAFVLNEEEALLVTSSAPYSMTAQPLYLRAEGLTVTQAIESVQAFILLHYGAKALPKLPVTLYRGEELAAAIAKGTLVGGEYSVVPWWL
jgi:argonaute-like protein implicated in RNA metabolism and viral defense